jgi:hypothetical protein
VTSLRLEDVRKVLRSVRALYDRRADPGLVGTFARQAACRLAGAEAGMARQSPIGGRCDGHEQHHHKQFGRWDSGRSTGTDRDIYVEYLRLCHQ